MTKAEKKAIERLKEILKYWQTIVDIEDDIEREIEMNCYSEEMPFKEVKEVLNLIDKQQKEIEELKNINKMEYISRENVAHNYISLYKYKKLKQESAEELENKIHELNNYKYEINENYIPKSKIKEMVEEYVTMNMSDECFIGDVIDGIFVRKVRIFDYTKEINALTRLFECNEYSTESEQLATEVNSSQCDTQSATHSDTESEG